MDTMRTALELDVSGMHCSGCASTIQRSFEKRPGIFRVSVDVGLNRAILIVDAKQVTLTDVIADIKGLGFEATLKSITRSPNSGCSGSTERTETASQGDRESHFQETAIQKGTDDLAKKPRAGEGIYRAQPVGPYPTARLKVWLRRSVGTGSSTLCASWKPRCCGAGRQWCSPWVSWVLLAWNPLTLWRIYAARQRCRRRFGKHVSKACAELREMNGIVECFPTWDPPRPTNAGGQSSSSAVWPLPSVTVAVEVTLMYDPYKIGARAIMQALVQRLCTTEETAWAVMSCQSPNQAIEKDAGMIRTRLLGCLIPTMLILCLIAKPQRMGQLLDISEWLVSLMILLLSMPVIFWGGWMFHRRALLSLRQGYLSMELLLSSSTLLTVVYSLVILVMARNPLRSGATLLAFEASLPGDASEDHNYEVPFHLLGTPAIVITTVLFGKLVELRAKCASRKILCRVSSSVQPATLLTVLGKVNSEGCPITAKEAEQHPGSLLELNDLVLLRSGVQLPVDGTLESGLQHKPLFVDESVVTGESSLVSKVSGDTLWAGSRVCNGEGVLRVSAVGEATYAGQLEALVLAATVQKSQTQRVADSIASWFVPTVFTVFLATTILWSIEVLRSNSGKGFTASRDWLNAAHVAQCAIAVLCVACPCAIGLAVPIAVSISLGKGARFGCLLRGLQPMENVYRKPVTDIVFDKTGTLTTGHFQLRTIELYPVKPTQDLTSDTRFYLSKTASEEKTPNSEPLCRAAIELHYYNGVSTENAFDDCGTSSDQQRLYLHPVYVLWGAASLQLAQGNSVASTKSNGGQVETPSRVCTNRDGFAALDDGTSLPVCSSFPREHPVGKALLSVWNVLASDTAFKTEWAELCDLQTPIEAAYYPGNGVWGVLTLSPPAWTRQSSTSQSRWAVGTETWLQETNKEGVPQLALIKEENSAESNPRLNGKTAVYVTVNGDLVALLRFAEIPRPESTRTINALKERLHANIWMCTGDCREAAFHLASCVGIHHDRVRYRLDPREKLDFITSLLNESRVAPYDEEQLWESRVRSNKMYRALSAVISKVKVIFERRKRGRCVIMIGDGVNDAAALAAASVGIAMGAAFHSTAFSADVVLLRSRLTDILCFLELSRATVRVIYRNFFWVFGFNLLTLPLAAGAFAPWVTLPPALAGALMVISSLVVVGHSSLLLFFRPKWGTEDARPASASRPLPG